MVHDRRHQKRVTIYRAKLPGADELWEVEYEAVAEALHFACRDLREERRIPLEILEDGVVIHDAESIARICEERTADDFERRVDESDSKNSGP